MFKHIVRMLSVMLIVLNIYPSEKQYSAEAYAKRGRRDYMEDTDDIVRQGSQRGNVNGFGVYDGHGGVGVARFLQQYLLRKVIEHLITAESSQSIAQSIDQGFLAVTEQLNSSLFYNTTTVGSCALAAIIVRDVLHVANVGDSRAVIGAKDGTFKALSKDHKADPAVNSKECDRIRAAGGEILNNRVNGLLAVTRAFGDRILSPAGVLSVPEVASHSLTESDSFLILATDGVWDAINNKTAVTIVQRAIEEGKGACAGAKVLVETALNRGSTDNATAIVIDLTQ